MSNKDVVIIGCRTPSGIELEISSGQKIVLNGQRQAQERSPIIMLTEDDCGFTIVPKDFWDQWKLEYAGYQPLEYGAIFEAKDERDAKAIHKELKKEKTGHEPLDQVDGKIEKAE